MNRLDVLPSEAVFIGDRLDTDYLGAEKAGFIPVLMRRGHKQPQVAGVRCISNLKEISKILEEIEESP